MEYSYVLGPHVTCVHVFPLAAVLGPAGMLLRQHFSLSMPSCLAETIPCRCLLISFMSILFEAFEAFLLSRYCAIVDILVVVESPALLAWMNLCLFTAECIATSL